MTFDAIGCLSCLLGEVSLLVVAAVLLVVLAVHLARHGVSQF